MDKRKVITSDALQAVISGSPVDTGAYKGNHKVSLDGEDLSSDPLAADPSGQDTLARGEAVIGQIDTAYGYAVVQNNIAYAQRLEDGHSQRAPSGIYGPAFEFLRAKHAK
ncbi:hypothetical protein V8Z80_08530 [Orrella sp. JC864]|uniref:hypothetical protein n=1 Tax=Orrella sp. JC864 TaxID=3120298 RepID=UPI003008421D